MSELIKVLLVDDHESMRELLEREFIPEKGFTVTDGIGSAADAVAFCILSNPDLVIIDVCTDNGASGLDAAAKILKRFPGIKVIVNSGFDEVTYMPRAKELGAHAFIYKSKGAAHYLEVAKRVLDGEYVFPEPKTILLQQGEAPFTDREMEILRLMCKCMTVREIAEELYISKNTVDRHIENMRLKSGRRSSIALMVYVLSNGWINPNY